MALAWGASAAGAIGSAEDCPWAHVPVDPESIIHTKEFKSIQRNLGRAVHAGPRVCQHGIRRHRRL